MNVFFCRSGLIQCFIHLLFYLLVNTYHKRYALDVDKCPVKRISVKFYCLASGKEPVLEWLKLLDKADKRIVGFDIKTVEEGWPLGMPLVEKHDKNLWKVRSNINDGCITWVFFTIAKRDPEDP